MLIKMSAAPCAWAAPAAQQLDCRVDPPMPVKAALLLLQNGSFEQGLAARRM